MAWLAGLYGLVFFSRDPGTWRFFFHEDVQRAWRLLIGQGARPVFLIPGFGPGEPGHDAMPRAHRLRASRSRVIASWVRIQKVTGGGRDP